MLTISSPEAVRSLGSYLSHCRYTAENLIEELDVQETLHPSLENLEPLLEKTNGASPAHLLARLFFVGWQADAALCSRVLDPAALSTALECGLLRQTGPHFEPLALLVPFKELIVACDAIALYKGTDVVVGPSSSTRTLHQCDLPGRGETTLDMCTGTGVLAFSAAASSAQVVAADINQRALQFARFSAALNGIENVEFLCGDAFAPVQGRAFSRIIANPPFFLTPAKKFTFSDSPLELDGFARKLALEAPTFLTEGGFFQMICEWVQIEGEPWTQRLQSWTHDSGCDVLVLHGSRRTPVAYAEKRSKEMKAVDPSRQDSLFSSRLDSLRESRVEAVLGGIITMRKRSGANWFAQIVAPDVSEAAGASIREKFDALTVLATHSDEDLLRAAFRFSGSAVIVQQTALGEAGWEAASALVKETGLKDRVQLDSVVLQFIPLFDGQHSTDEIAELVKRQLEISKQEAQQRCLHLVRRMLQGGFVHPAG